MTTTARNSSCLKLFKFLNLLFICESKIIFVHKSPADFADYRRFKHTI